MQAQCYHGSEGTANTDSYGDRWRHDLGYYLVGVVYIHETTIRRKEHTFLTQMTHR